MSAGERSRRVRLACPYCRAPNDEHESIDDPALRPADGDVSVCFSCRRLGLFVADAAGGIRIRRPTSGEVRRALAAAAESYSGDQAVRLARGDRR